MITQAGLDIWTSRISYKERWTVRAEPIDEQKPWCSGGPVRIHVGYTGRNSTAPGERVVSHARNVNIRNFDDFVREVVTTFQELENHEIREWFRVDGEHWPEFLPHDPKAVTYPLRATGARYD